MSNEDVDLWLSVKIPSFVRLTDNVVSILKNLLAKNKVDYLSVEGRTKNFEDCKEKIERKGYMKPEIQLTDISGVRVIVNFEQDIATVQRIIEKSFNVDPANSLDKDRLLSANELGYRSVHYVCDLGVNREKLPEFEGIGGLKFELQIRTVLQHAWAELAHDRNYKFSGKLPRAIERKLYLFAGMLEIADKGFSELSHEIDQYKKNVQSESAKGQLDIELNSLSLDQFVNQWAKNNHVKLAEARIPNTTVLKELGQIGIEDLRELSAIIPSGYAEVARKGRRRTLIGIVRHWMVISSFEEFIKNTKLNYSFREETLEMLRNFLKPDQIERLVAASHGIAPHERVEMKAK